MHRKFESKYYGNFDSNCVMSQKFIYYHNDNGRGHGKHLPDALIKYKERHIFPYRSPKQKELTKIRWIGWIGWIENKSNYEDCNDK